MNRIAGRFTRVESRRRAEWDADQVRDDVRAYVIEH